MSETYRDPLAVFLFALGGVLLVLDLFEILDNVGKPWINRTLLLVYLVLPLAFGAFLALGLGLLLMLRSQRRGVTS